jgi:hypothetical protein
MAKFLHFGCGRLQIVTIHDFSGSSETNRNNKIGLMASGIQVFSLHANLAKDK